VPVDEVQALLGHASPDMTTGTGDFFDHLRDEARLVARLERLPDKIALCDQAQQIQQFPTAAPRLPGNGPADPRSRSR